MGCFFLRDFVASRSSFRLLSLAATRSCSRVSCVNRVLTTALQFDFRGFFPLTARSIGSRVSWLRWPMLSWFSLLFRGSFSLSCALPVMIVTGVTPLLRRRPLRFTQACLLRCLRFGLHSPLLVDSTVRLLAPLLLLHALRLLPFDRQPSHLVYRLSTPTNWCSRLSCFSLLRRVASYLPFELDLRAGLPLCWIATKQFQPSLTFVSLFLTKNEAPNSR